MTAADLERPGAWTKLFPHALRLMRHLEARIPGALWTFGGGTVLMLRYLHRQSRDIDLFVPDPQYLGYVNPRLSDVADEVSSDYEEAAEFIKLYLADGEIDVVAAASLTPRPHEVVRYRHHDVRVETAAEIIAKKMWHRGDRARGRDLLDLCTVARVDMDEIRLALPFLEKNAARFLSALDERADLLQIEFDQIDTIGKQLTFEECRVIATDILRPLARRSRNA